jgi:hypothetical protein
MKKPQFLHHRNELTSEGNSDQLLDQILTTDNMMSLPDDFADRIAMKAIQRMTLKQSLKEFLIYTGVVSGILIAFMSVMYLFSNENVNKWVDILVPNISLLIGITLILIFILFLDRVVLPQSFLRKRENNLS